MTWGRVITITGTCQRFAPKTNVADWAVVADKVNAS